MITLLSPYRLVATSAGDEAYNADVAATAPEIWIKAHETSPATLADASGNGRTFAQVGGGTVTSVADREGNADGALKLDGTAYYEAADVSGDRVSTPGLGGWFKLDALPAGAAVYVLASKDESGFDWGHHARVTSDGTLEVVAQTDRDNFEVFLRSPAGAIVAGQWHSVALTTHARGFMAALDGAWLHDGIPDGLQAHGFARRPQTGGGFTGNTAPWRIGKAGWSSATPGLSFHDLVVYRRTLTQADLNDLADVSSPTPLRDPRWSATYDFTANPSGYASVQAAIDALVDTGTTLEVDAGTHTVDTLRGGVRLWCKTHGSGGRIRTTSVVSTPTPAIATADMTNALVAGAATATQVGHGAAAGDMVSFAADYTPAAATEAAFDGYFYAPYYNYGLSGFLGSDYSAEATKGEAFLVTNVAGDVLTLAGADVHQGILTSYNSSPSQFRRWTPNRDVAAVGLEIDSSTVGVLFQVGYIDSGYLYNCDVATVQDANGPQGIYMLGAMYFFVSGFTIDGIVTSTHNTHYGVQISSDCKHVAVVDGAVDGIKHGFTAGKPRTGASRGMRTCST